MKQKSGVHQNTKISGKFAARLANLAAGQKIRAIVLLQTGGAGTAMPSRGAAGTREVAVQTARGEAEAAFPDIDQKLREFGGRRVSSGADALGGIVVEATAAAILSLASLGRVKAVLEDQQLSIIR